MHSSRLRCRDDLPAPQGTQKAEDPGRAQAETLQAALEGREAVRLAEELSAPGGALREASGELPGVRTAGLCDDSTQALVKRSQARSVPTATAEARLHTALYSSLLRISVMASSKGSACPLAHVAANTSSPSASRAAATVRSCSARFAGGSGQPIYSRSAEAAPQICAARSILPCATFTRASPSRQTRMVWLRPIRRPPSSRLSSYNLAARAYSPASHATLPRLARVRAMPQACSLSRDKARLSSSSIFARPRSPCSRTASPRARRLQAMPNVVPDSRARARDCLCRPT